MKPRIKIDPSRLIEKLGIEDPVTFSEDPLHGLPKQLEEELQLFERDPVGAHIIGALRAHQASQKLGSCNTPEVPHGEHSIYLNIPDIQRHGWRQNDTIQTVCAHELIHARQHEVLGLTADQTDRIESLRAQLEQEAGELSHRPELYSLVIVTEE